MKSQNELGVSQLTEKRLEMVPNKKSTQEIFSRQNVKHENYYIFKRRLLVSDPYLVNEGNIKAFRKSLFVQP